MTPGAPAGGEEFFPLAPLQEGMLYHALAEPGARVYFNQLTLPLDGDLDESALRTAWQAAVDRHPALRTRLVWEGVPEPLQVVEARVTLPWERHDLAGWPEDGRAEALESLRRADRRRGFDLARGPLLRASLVRSGAARHHLVFSHHHVLMDGWSLFKVLGEVFDDYEVVRLGSRPERTAPRPFRDFVSWLRERDAGRDAAYWRAALAGLRAPTPLVLDRPAADGPGPGEDTASEGLLLPPPALGRARNAARSARVTLGTLVQGAWGLLLSRLSGEHDVLFGTVVSGRPPELAGADEMVGLLINTLPTRVRVPEDTAVGDWLRELQARQLEALERSHTRLVDALAASDLPRGRPAFESLLLFENYPKGAPVSRAGRTLDVGPATWFEWFSDPLTALAVPGAEGLELRLIHHPSRFERTAIVRMLGRFARLVEELAADPSRPLRAVELTGDAERAVISRLATGPEAGPPACLHERVLVTAARRRDAIAVTHAGDSLTYGELAGRVGLLAADLAARGIGREDRVGVFLEPGLDLPAALLAVLAAGACYVPLDPGHPAERLRYVAGDARLRAVLTTSVLTPRLPVEGLDVIRLDRAVLPAPRPATAVPPHQLAYLLYTSGSTGRPKGVAVSHASVVNLLDSMRHEPGFGEGDALLSVTSLGFDIAALELFLPLLAGGRLELAARDEVADGARLAKRLAASGANVVQATPATWRLLLEAGWPGDPSLTVLVGGEALPPRLARELHARCRAVFNVYGPTETTIWSTLWRVEPGPVRIGRPVAGTRVAVLDDALRTVPPGVPGELFIGGAGVARGYWDRPALTAARFVPDPEGPGRLYRTGDRVRLHEDGQLEFLERVDRQVKLRGHRIEPAEIEAVLEEQPGVARAAVLLREDAPDEPRLVAYVVAAPGASVEAAVAREALRRKLPEAMVPAAFVLLDALPLTPNGKVDRLALPAPGSAPAGASLPPEGELEARVAASWRDVLGLARVGRDESFFDVGGHSLLLLRLRNRLAELDPSLDVVDLFRYPTVRSQAAFLAGRTGEGEETAGAARAGAARASARREKLRGLLDRRRAGSSSS